MRWVFPLIGLLALGACQPTIPDSAAGVGFEDYGQFLRAREAEARSQRAAAAARPPVTTVAGTEAAAGSGAAGAPLSAIPSLGRDGAQDGALAAGGQGGDSPEAIAQAALAALAPASGAPEAGTWPTAGSPEPGAPAGAAGISDQVFDPTRPRDETEAERIARQGSQPQLIQPEALPERPADSTNIVAYALSTTHRVGQQQQRRSAIQLRSHERACAQFASQDLAQEEFLRRGGPERDPLNLDPDGDGFACWWDPEPFRAAARAAREPQ